MLNRRTKLFFIVIAGLISVALYLAFFYTGDGRLIYLQFPGFMAAFSMCGETGCRGSNGATAILTWILFSLIQYYAILRLFSWVYLRFSRK